MFFEEGDDAGEGDFFGFGDGVEDVEEAAGGVEGEVDGAVDGGLGEAGLR